VLLADAAIGVNYFLGLGGKPGKLFDPAWMSGSTAIRGFWERAVAVPAEPGAKPAIAFDWYREFLSFLLATNADVWFAKLIVAGELLVGLALVLGALTGIAAFGGGLMNWSFMMAGTVSVSPLMFLLTVLLILGWKVAGYHGVDRILLPMLGTPWSRPGRGTAPEPSGIGTPKRPKVAYGLATAASARRPFRRPAPRQDRGWRARLAVACQRCGRAGAPRSGSRTGPLPAA
jgi:thiosulfate dehydrogenase (quinone) large subunit